ncbi:neurotrypsin-like isoform X2 [Acanthaster planci]|uniref:Neurotrypsin-like isoform X2 n=1 Tax=Acanthaster planci TaxID=133434 RepID=A0A8B7YWV1_ACAPL|nr:neurotrypsin-like isoform X2 [Acanthaster planci]
MASSAFQKILVIIALVALSAHSLEEEQVVQRPLLSESPCTSEPLGMESGAIPDSAITASSVYASSYVPTKVRPNSGSYWVPKPNENQWIQVDLSIHTAVTGVVMNGVSSGGNYIRTFTVLYSESGRSDDWAKLADVEGNAIQFAGNNGSRQQVTVTFPVIVVARILRLLPTSWSGNIFLNLELLGCRGLDGMVRLVDGDRLLSGRVEIYHDDTWGAICDNGWDMKEASIVCHMLGFLETEEATAVSFEESEEVPIVMNRVSCKGTEKRLADCPFLCTGTQQCNSSRAAGVTCKPNVIRLVGGSNHTSGRVEIYQAYKWGTLCDTDWDVTDANVVCRQLGFSGAEEAKSGAHFGQGEGPVFMNGLACDGSESKITDCPSFCWEDIRCNHTHDAGVVCRQGDVEYDSRREISHP